MPGAQDSRRASERSKEPVTGSWTLWTGRAPALKPETLALFSEGTHGDAQATAMYADTHTCLLHMGPQTTIRCPQPAMGCPPQATMLPVTQTKNSGLSWAPLFLTPCQQIPPVLPLKFIWDWKLFIPHVDLCSSRLTVTHIALFTAARDAVRVSGRSYPPPAPLHSESKPEVQPWPPQTLLSDQLTHYSPTVPLTVIPAHSCLRAFALAVPLAKYISSDSP